MWSQRKITYFVVLLSIASGLAFLKVGLIIYEGNNEYQSEKNSQTKPYMAHETYIGKFGLKGNVTAIRNSTTITTNPYTHMAFVNMTLTRFTIPNATLVIAFEIKFTSPEAFAVDNNINYTIKASVYPISNFKNFYFVLNSTHNNLYQNKTDIDKVMSFANDTGELVKLKRENATYFDKINGNWTDPIEDQISVFAIIDNGQNKSMSGNSPFLLTIAPHLNKLQADTDLDIQKQNLETIKSNMNVEALTWLIIALIPIGFVIETVIHGFMLRDESSNVTMRNGKHIKNLEESKASEPESDAFNQTDLSSKQLHKLNMMDFSEYLLNYTERYFTKVTDLANIILALVAAIGALIAIAFVSPEKNLLPVGASIAILLGLLYAVIKISITNHNKHVYDIEESIFHYSANINKKSTEEQLQIFKRLHILFGNRRWGFSSKPSHSEIEQFKQLLSSQPEKTE